MPKLFSISSTNSNHSRDRSPIGKNTTAGRTLGGKVTLGNTNLSKSSFSLTNSDEHKQPEARRQIDLDNTFNFSCDPFDGARTQLREISTQLKDITSCLSVMPAQLTHGIESALNNLSSIVASKMDRLIQVIETQHNFGAMSNQMEVNIPHSIDPETEYITFREKLRQLKEDRNNSFYKISYNKTHADIYKNGLINSPQSVPNKYHAQFYEDDEIAQRESKKNLTIAKIEYEIGEHLRHCSIHENKLKMVDEKVVQVLANVQNNDVKERLSKNWAMIIQRSEEIIKKKWETKTEFLKSTHMVELGSITKRPMYHATEPLKYQNAPTFQPRQYTSQDRQGNIPARNIMRTPLSAEYDYNRHNYVSHDKDRGYSRAVQLNHQKPTYRDQFNVQYGMGNEKNTSYSRAVQQEPRYQEMNYNRAPQQQPERQHNYSAYDGGRDDVPMDNMDESEWTVVRNSKNVNRYGQTSRWRNQH
jgi:hypothetical protein